MEYRELMEEAVKFGKTLSNVVGEKNVRIVYSVIIDMADKKNIVEFSKYIANKSIKKHFKLPNVIANIMTYDKSVAIDVIYSILLGLTAEQDVTIEGK